MYSADSHFFVLTGNNLAGRGRGRLAVDAYRPMTVRGPFALKTPDQSLHCLQRGA